jgi:hypothetical protein
MRHFLPAVLTLFAGCALAHGDLGDTLPQIEARYGPAQETKQDVTTGALVKYYVHDGFGIAVKFLESKSQSESYIKGRKADFTDPEIAALLKANALGSDWQSVYKTAGTDRWELMSRGATAVYFHANHTLVFSTIEFIRATTKVKLVDPGQ